MRGPESNPTHPELATSAGGEVHVLSFKGSDADLLDRIRRGGPGAAALIYDRFSADVNRMVWRLLGADADHDDLVQQVFIHLLKGVGRVREAEKLRSFVLSVTVNTVRSELRKRSVRRRFMVRGIEHPERLCGTTEDHDGRALLRDTFAILDKLPVDERLAFTLRYVDGQGLETVADMCDCSLSTIKRRLSRAEKRFTKLASRNPGLAERLSRGTRWGAP